MGQKRRHEARQQREPLHENGRRRWQRQEVLDQKSEALTLEAVERIAQLREAKASNRRSAPSSSRRPATPERRDTGVVGLAKGMPQEMLRGAGMERLWSRAVATVATGGKCDGSKNGSNSRRTRDLERATSAGALGHEALELRGPVGRSCRHRAVEEPSGSRCGREGGHVRLLSRAAQGAMLWLRWKRFSGSQVRLSSRSRLYFDGPPYAASLRASVTSPPMALT